MVRIPCGRVLGHGESCCEGNLCTHCAELLSKSDKFKCKLCSCVYVREAQENNWCAIPCPYCTIDVLTTMIDKIEPLLHEHACAPVKEEYGWECPICAYLDDQKKNSIPLEEVKFEERKAHPPMGGQVSED